MTRKLFVGIALIASVFSGHGCSLLAAPAADPHRKITNTATFGFTTYSTDKAVQKLNPKGIQKPPTRRGVIIANIVSTCSAYKVGLRSGDIIFRIDSKQINTPKNYADFLDSMTAGTTYKLGAMRLVGNKWKRAYFDVAVSTREELLGPGGCPLTLLKVGVSANIINTPVLSIHVQNVSDKTIDNYEIQIDCYDHRGEELEAFGKKSESFFSDKPIRPFGTNISAYTLDLHDTARGAKVRITSVQTHDGQIWKIPQNGDCPSKTLFWRE